ncbi:MAG: hypothetical protein EPO10_04675 [Reyranella sp.]|nr:MAG: hypothetical protein EPO10_04675 [Reyranella sp.]
MGRVLPDTTASKDTAPLFRQFLSTPQSASTVHLIDEAGQLTVATCGEAISFFARRLVRAEA